METGTLWTVQQHDGKRGSGWKVVFAGVLAQARSRYLQLARLRASQWRGGVCKGGVRLVNPEDAVVCERGERRLRHVWRGCGRIE